jgi:PEP-CTERM motif-containing protein
MSNSLIVACLAVFLTMSAGSAFASAPVTHNGNAPQTAPRTRSVPEPATVLLLGAAAGVAVGVRKLWTKRK